MTRGSETEQGIPSSGLRLWGMRGTAVVLAIALALLLGELALRVGIALGYTPLRAPSLYANLLGDDDYWLLRHRWTPGGGLPFGRNVVHPTLGWAPPETQLNPLGVNRRENYVPQYDDRVVLFFGDSFVAGDLPAVVEAALRTRFSEPVPVYNYGVGGYGLDQILLRFELSHSRFSNPLILFGILLTDFDRSILSIRDAPKPHFAIEDGKLVLHGVPVPEDPGEYMREAPLSFESFLLALVRQQRLRRAPGGGGMETTYRREEKETLNRLLLERVMATAAERALSIRFVLFYTMGGMRQEGWRERYAKGELARLDAPYFDTKPVLLQAAQESGIDWRDYYLPDGHHSPEGNRVIGEALARSLSSAVLADESEGGSASL